MSAGIWLCRAVLLVAVAVAVSTCGRLENDGHDSCPSLPTARMITDLQARVEKDAFFQPGPFVYDPAGPRYSTNGMWVYDFTFHGKKGVALIGCDYSIEISLPR